MDRRDLSRIVRETVPLTARQSAGLVARLVDAMRDALADGERIELRGFGTFRIQHLKEFHSNLQGHIPARKKAKFKQSSILKEALNADREGKEIAR